MDEYQADDIPEAGTRGFTVSPGVPLSQINNPGDVDWVRASEKDKVYKIDVLGLGDGHLARQHATASHPDGAQLP